jgi:MinD-like ATPase involved in chromosome partitioning or flagellar assembly
MSEIHTIMITSQKGGVGKTTISVNLAIALTLRGHKVLLVEGDIYNPSIAFHLGMEDTNLGVRAVLTNRIDLAKAATVHGPTGLHVLTGEQTTKQMSIKIKGIKSLYNQAKALDYRYIIFDTPPSIIDVEDIEMIKGFPSTDAIIVVTPEMSACISAVKLAKLYNQLGIRYEYLVNRIKNKKYELHVSEIEDFVDQRMHALLPEDDQVPLSIAMHIPLYLMNKKSKFSKEIEVLAKHIEAETVPGYDAPEENESKSPNRLKSFFKE